jgi:hypothetical protein
MKKLKITVILLLFLQCSTMISAQSIQPIYNRRIFSVMEVFELNKTKDTIIIGGQYKIKRIKIINKQRRVVTYRVNDDYFELPIAGLREDFYIIEVVYGGHKAKFVLYGSKQYNYEN